MWTIEEALKAAEPRPAATASSVDKKNYAERFSRKAALCLANSLRKDFPSILPKEDGSQQESRARTGRGYKKLDVNYSTPELGLGLGVSVKSINFRDPATRRYTKNYSRNDNELRSEAMDYHHRQPYAVLVGVVFLPFDSCDDANQGPKTEQGVSSFGAAVKYFRGRAGRDTPHQSAELFERFFIGLYDPEARSPALFFDVLQKPPRNRRPTSDEVLTLQVLVSEIRATYDHRNSPQFDWAE